MSTEQLSQQEIDLLFSGAPAPARPSATRRQADVQLYDFRRPNLISKDRMRGLDAMYGILAKGFESWLIAWTRGQVSVELMSVEHFSFGEFLLSLPNPCSSFVYNISGAEAQQAVLDFGRELAFYVVDRLLGGTGSPVLLERALTPVERMVVRIAADKAASYLAEAWRDHVQFDLSLARFESMPDMLQAAGREEPVLVAHLQVRAGDVQSPLMLCLPFNALERFFTSTTTRRGPTRQLTDDLRRATDNAIRNVSVPVVVRLPDIFVPLSTLAQLRVGGMLHTGLPTDVALTAMVQGETRFKGNPGRTGRRLAFRIATVLGQQVSTADSSISRRIFNMNSLDTLSEMSEAVSGAEPRDIVTLYDLSLPVTIELGRTTMSVQDVLSLGRGSVIQLDRLVGEPIDVFVGDRRFAQGEVVVIGEEFGVRITRMATSSTATEEVQ